MDCDKNNEPIDKEEPEDDLSKPDLESSEKNLEAQESSPESEQNEETESSNKILPTSSTASELFRTSFSRESESASNIPDPGPFQSLTQRLPKLSKMKEDENDQLSRRLDFHSSNSSMHCNFIAPGLCRTSSKAFEDAFGRPPIRPSATKQCLMEKDAYFKSKSIENSSTESSQSKIEASGMFESKAMETEGACGISGPTSTRQASLMEQSQDFNLMDNRHQGRVLDRAFEGPSRSNTALPMLNPIVRGYPGPLPLPGRFASFVQQHRDFNETDDSDDEKPEARPVWPLQHRQRERSDSYRDSRSGSLGECSEESRSTSEASHSSGIPDIKEASASESLPLQQFHRELNPPDDEATDEEGAIDEDEVADEPEERYDSDSERKGYSL